PPYLRRSRRLDEALPVLYLRGLSTGDFTPALTELLGEAAKGFSPASIVRLKSVWEEEYRTWKSRDLSGSDWVYVFADGVNFPVRLEADRLCCLVLVGVRRDGTKELIALEDGYRESEEAWLSLLRDLKRRGMPAPALAVGDGALGFWAALEEVWPECARQRSPSGHPGTQVAQRAGQTARPAARARQRAAARGDVRREPKGRGRSEGAVRGRVRGQVSPSGSLAEGRVGGDGHLPRLSRRALGAVAQHQRDRERLQPGKDAHPQDERSGLPPGRAGDGVQAGSGGAAPLAEGQRAAAGAAGPRGGLVPRREDRGRPAVAGVVSSRGRVRRALLSIHNS